MAKPISTWMATSRASVAKLLGHYGRPEGQDQGAVDADRRRDVSHRSRAYRLARGSGTGRGTRLHRTRAARLLPVRVEAV